METLRTLLTATFLAALALGIFYFINRPTESEPQLQLSGLTDSFKDSAPVLPEDTNAPQPVFENSVAENIDYPDNSNQINTPLTNSAGNANQINYPEVSSGNPAISGNLEPATPAGAYGSSADTAVGNLNSLPVPTGNNSVNFPNPTVIPQTTVPQTASQTAAPTSAGTDAYKAEREIVAQFFSTANDKIKNGDLLDTLKELGKWYGHPSFTDEEREILNRMLVDLASEVIYVRPEIYLNSLYLISANDDIQKIADQNQVPWQFLAKVNGLKRPFHLTPGNTLKVVHGPFHAKVNTSTFELTLWLPLNQNDPQSAVYAGTFHIGTGSDSPLIPGNYIVEEKYLNPEYHVNETMFASNDPNNPYGNRLLWLASIDNPQSPRIGIHGTNNPANIRSSSPRGNISLGPRDIDDLFDILSIGSRIIIEK